MIIRTASPPGFFYCFFQLSHFSHPYPIPSHNSHPFPFLPSPPISPITSTCRYADISIYRAITPFLNKKCLLKLRRHLITILFSRYFKMLYSSEASEITILTLVNHSDVELPMSEFFVLALFGVTYTMSFC